MRVANLEERYPTLPDDNRFLHEWMSQLSREADILMHESSSFERTKGKHLNRNIGQQNQISTNDREQKHYRKRQQSSVDKK